MEEVRTRKAEGRAPEIPPEEWGTPEEITVEEKRRRLKEMDDKIRASVAENMAKHEAEWQIVRAALLRRRAVEKEARRRKKRGRGPP